MLPQRKVIELNNTDQLSSSQNHIPHEDNNLQGASSQLQFHQKHLKHTGFIYLMSLNACLGSFFFGYNLGVYNTTQKVIQKLNGWSDSDATNYTSIITAAMPLGAFIAALFSKRLIGAMNGIRRSMMVFDILGIIGTIILISDHQMSNLIIGRLISGFCIGMNTSLVPEYIRDFAPTEIRSRVGSLNQSLLTLGVFASYLMSLVLPLPSELKQDPNGNYDVNWRFVLGLPIATCSIRLILLCFKYKHETPTILVMQHKYQEVKEYLQMVYDDDEDIKQAYSEILEVAGVGSSNEAVDQLQNTTHDHNGVAKKISQFKLQETVDKEENKNRTKKEDSINHSQIPNSADIVPQNEEHQKQEKILELLDKSTYNKRLLLGCIIQYATQCSGVNALLFYSNVIFSETTGDELTSRICTIFLGLSMAVYALISMVLITKFGRRAIMNSSIVLTVSMLLLFAILQQVEQNSITQITGMIFIFTYMFGWQAGLGTTTWVYNNEILDRKGLALASFVRWLFTMIVGVIFPYMNQSIKLFGSFIVFGVLTLMCLAYFIFAMNETKGKSRVEILKCFDSKDNILKFENEANEYVKQRMSQYNKNIDDEQL